MSLPKMNLTFFYFVFLSISSLFAQGENSIGKLNKKYHYFDNPQVCSGCHWNRFDHWNVSPHSKGFSGDFFQKQFYDLVLPSRSFDEKVEDVHIGCIRCHSPTAYLSKDLIPKPTKNPDTHWNRGTGFKTEADRGIFYDFCHTLDGFKNNPPFNFDFISTATAGIDPKRASLEFSWSPYHKNQTSEIFEGSFICATCHNELNPYGVWVKATELEYSKSVYPDRPIVCQNCHMQPMAGKPGKMGPLRAENHDHWFGGGFAEFVEGAAKGKIDLLKNIVSAGEQLDFKINIHSLATGHKFPTGSVEERDIWLHVTLVDKDLNEIAHIPIPQNTNNPNDKYFITSNEKIAYPSHSKLSKPIVRDDRPEGDRIYHSAFLDDSGRFTYAEWFAAEEIENRLNPLEFWEEFYTFKLPATINIGEIFVLAVLNYRRMPDSLADYFKIDRRPIIEVSRDIAMLTIK